MVPLLHPSLSDFKANVLVNHTGRACLAGFSPLTMVEEQPTYAPSSTWGDAVRWMSPELFNPEMLDSLKDSHPTKESDYYALGMVIYEVLSGQAPFAPCRYLTVIRKILRGDRPKRPQGDGGKPFTDDIWGILERCWKYQPHDRISASSVLLCLEKHPPLLRPPFAFDLDGDAGTGGDNQWGVGTWGPGNNGQLGVSAWGSGNSGQPELSVRGPANDGQSGSGNGGQSGSSVWGSRKDGQWYTTAGNCTFSPCCPGLIFDSPCVV
jgi:serine/threonine protein kinase